MKQLLLIVLLFSLCSCGVIQNNICKKKEVIASIQTSPCRGTCSVYKTIFYSDGTGVFNGIKNTVLGTKNFVYTLEEMENIIEFSKEINFSDIGDKYYNRGLQDLQISTITIKGKSVKYNENPPPELRKLFGKFTGLFHIPDTTLSIRLQ